MAGSTTKKVIVRKIDGHSIAGYANPQTYLRAEGVEILTREGQTLLTPYEHLKAVYFVRDFETGAEDRKKVFQSRPKLGGLWVRMRFRDDDLLDGILPNDLLQLSDKGVTVTPPDPNANTQKIFVPRLALAELSVLGVIGSPLTKPRAKAVEEKKQIDLFEK